MPGYNFPPVSVGPPLMCVSGVYVVVCVATCMYVHLWFGVGHNVCIGGAIKL